MKLHATVRGHTLKPALGAEIPKKYPAAVVSAAR
jgi:hypothetical protein